VINIPKNSWLRILGAATFGLFISLTIGAVFNKKALAFSTITPIQASAPATNSANIYGSGTNIQPWFAVGEGAYDGTYSYAKVYVPHGQTATLTVLQGNGICGIDVGSPQVNYEVYRLNSLENIPTGTTSARIGIKDNSGGCGALTFSLSGGTPSSRTGHQAYDVYYFQATIVGPGFGDNEKNFRLSVNNGLIGVSRPVGAVGNKPWFGIYMRDAPQRGGNNWDYAVQFAPYCNEDPTVTSKSVAVHDIDWQIYNQPNLTGLVDRDDRADSNFSWVLSPPGEPSSKKVQNDWPSGDHTDTKLTFNYADTNRYLLEFNDVDWHNTIQISLPFDQFDAKQSVGTACSQPPQQTAVPACSANVANTTIPINTTENITVNLKNNSDLDSGPTFPTSYQIRQISLNGSPGGAAYNLKASLPPGGATQTYTFSPVARSTPQTVQFYYDLFDGSLSSSNPVGSQHPLCGIQITWTGLTGGPNSVATSCINTAVQLTTTATENFPASYQQNPSPYWTTVTPSGGAPDGHYFWNSVPAAASPQPPSPTTTETTLYLGVLYFRYGDLRTAAGGSSTPAKDIPGYVQWYDSNNNPAGPQVQFDLPANSSGSVVYAWSGHTFNDFNFLLPQNTYTIKVFAQIAGTFTQGTPTDETFIGQSALPQCLQAHLSGDFPNVCGGGTDTTVEIGQQSQVSYTLNIENKTNVEFDGRGYQMQLNPTSGIQVTSSNPVGVDIRPSGPTMVSINKQFTIVVQNSGSYSVAFLFNGSLLDSIGPDNWGGTCGGGTITGVVKPYFQAWAGSVSAGGGFRSPGQNDSGSCGGTSDPPYISPVVSGNQNSGGIEAFGKQSSDRGSRTDFGALALGMIIGNPGGDTGFYSGDAAAGDRMVYANSLGGFFSSNMGGYLNSNSQGHCASDFYTNTQASPKVTTGSLGGDVADCQANGGRCQYDFSNIFSNLTNSDVTIPAGVQITIYVNHDVTINGNIRYASFNPTDQTNVPYFALVVKGSITVTGNVRQLDGLYVAQPNGTANGGTFATCDGTCNSQLVVNGAVIAQEVDLLRNHGTLSGGSDAAITGNPAEVFNFVPSMIIGLPAFAAQFGAPQGIFSLPPVF
jgi:hypothetical protein